MGKSRFWLLRLFILNVGTLATISVLAMDLQPMDANPVKVGACAHQLRFKVKLASSDHEYGASNIGANYRIGIYSARDKAPLTTFSVSGHKTGENIVFVVPSDLLSCVHGVTIVVDDKKQIRESNKSNNTIKVKWKQHGKTFGSACAVQMEKCSK